MGIRFRKSFKVAPGVKINLNKKSTSMTFGGKGVHYTINSNGKKTKSVGIPGTGISYSETSSSKKRVSRNSSTPFNSSSADFNYTVNEDFEKILTPKEFNRYSKDTQNGFVYDEDATYIITPRGKRNKIFTYKISSAIFLIVSVLFCLFALAGLTVSIPFGMLFMVFAIVFFIPFSCYKRMIRIHRKIFAWKNSIK